MTAHPPIPRLTDIIDAIEVVAAEIAGLTFDTFGRDRRKCWIVERGIEIISEASRRLPQDLEERHPEIPWPKVAGIGNILRHEYEAVEPDIVWRVVHHDLPMLVSVCRTERTAAIDRDG